MVEYCLACVSICLLDPSSFVCRCDGVSTVIIREPENEANARWIWVNFKALPSINTYYYGVSWKACCSSEEDS
jgi:hypothetical protein